MSKIHQAIRRAEREGQDLIQRSPVRRAILEDSRKETVEPRTLQEQIVQEFQNQESSPSRRLEAGEYTALRIPTGSKLVALGAEKSVAGEQYRALKAKIFQMRQVNGLKSLLVTSPCVSDGKTLTAANLALTIAQEIDVRVLIVDGDLRRPSVHKYLGVSHPRGLSDFLASRCSLEQIVLTTELQNLSLVQAGPIPDNPTELLNSKRMRTFLTHASEKFNWVILDSPPIVALADTDLLASMVDGVLLVVRAFQTPADLLAKSIESLNGKNLLGIVLNCYEDEKTRTYSYYYSNAVGASPES